MAIIVGGWVGVSTLVLVVTLDIEVVALYVLGVAGAVLISERASRFRPVAASLFGGAMIVLGLVLVKNAAAPMAEAPWFAALVVRTDGSLLLGFAAGALMTAIVQSSAVSDGDAIPAGRAPSSGYLCGRGVESPDHPRLVECAA